MMAALPKFKDVIVGLCDSKWVYYGARHIEEMPIMQAAQSPVWLIRCALVFGEIDVFVPGKLDSINVTVEVK